MEPFGLFHFLQTLLSPPPSDPSETEQNSVQPTEKIPLPERETPSAEGTKETPSRDAFLHFLSDHNERVNRIKNKR